MKIHKVIPEGEIPYGHSGRKYSNIHIASDSLKYGTALPIEFDSVTDALRFYHSAKSSLRKDRFLYIRRGKVIYIKRKR